MDDSGLHQYKVYLGKLLVKFTISNLKRWARPSCGHGFAMKTSLKRH